MEPSQFYAAAEAAEDWSFAYGVTAVLVSLLLGWGASAFFQRRYG